MKRKLLLSLGLFGLAALVWSVTPTELNITVASASVPGQLSSDTDLSCRTIVFVGMKSPRTNNTGTVYIQRNSTNDVGGIPLAAGATFTLTSADARQPLYPSQFYIDVVTTNDGVVAILIP